MFYEERMINGILHWRGTPRGQWYAVSDAVRLEGMRIDVQMMIRRAQALVDERRNSGRHTLTQFYCAVDHRDACLAFARELAERTR